VLGHKLRHQTLHQRLIQSSASTQKRDREQAKSFIHAQSVSVAQSVVRQISYVSWLMSVC